MEPSSHHEHSYKPAGAVQSILSEQLLQQQPVEQCHFKDLHALPKKFSANRGSKHEGKIRVNREVLAALKQVSAELDAAQRHYLAYKQYGEAGESLLKLAPDMISLPADGLAATGSQADVAAGEAGTDWEQERPEGAVRGRSSGDSSTGASSQAAAAAPKDPLVGHRRWGYFPMLRNLRASSAKSMQSPALAVLAVVRRSADEAPTVAAEAPAAVSDLVPDSPKMSWGALMRQKKAEKEQGIARMIRVKHAVLVIQRAWRATLQRRASRALAMMVLRAKVCRAHRAAYVSNLLRKKPRAAGANARASTDSTPEDAADADISSADAQAAASDTEVVLNEHGEVVLTQQQEAEFELQLQKVLEVAQAGKKAVLPLELAHIAGLLPDSESSSAALEAMAGSGVHGSSSSSEEEQEEEEEQAPVWKVISTPKAGPKKPFLRVETRITGGPNWQMGLRTPGTAVTPHRIGSPDSPASQHSGSSPSFKSSRSLKQSKSAKSRPGTSGSSRPGSRAQGRRQAAAAATAGVAAAAAAAASGMAGRGADAGAAEGQAHGAHKSKRTGAAVSFAVDGDAGDGLLAEEDSSTAGYGEEGQDEGSEGGSVSPRAGGRSARGVKVGKKGVGIVVAAAKNAVAVAKSDGEVVIRARSASKKLLKSASRPSTAAAAATNAAAAAGQECFGTLATAAAAASVGLDASQRSSPETGDFEGCQAVGWPVEQVWNPETGRYEVQGSTGSDMAGGWSASGLRCTAHDVLTAGAGSGSHGSCTDNQSASIAGWQVASLGHQGVGLSCGSTAWDGSDNTVPVANTLAAAAASTAGAVSPAPAGTLGADSGVFRQSVPEGRRVTGSGPAALNISRPGTSPATQGGPSASAACSAADGTASIHPQGHGQPAPAQGMSRRSTREGGPGGSRASTPPPNRSFFAGSSGNGAFNKYERGLADGLQQDFKVLQAESVTASRTPSPPSQRSHRASTPSRRVTSEVQPVQSAATGRSGRVSPQQGVRSALSAEQMQQGGQQQHGVEGFDAGQLGSLLLDQRQQQQQQGLGGAGTGGQRSKRVTTDGPAGSRTLVPDLELSIGSRAPGTGTAVPAPTEAADSIAAAAAAGAAIGNQAGPFFRISSFRSTQDGGADADAAPRASDALGMEQYAAQVAAYRASGLADPSALGGVVLGADGSLQQVSPHEQQQQEQQQVSPHEQQQQEQQQVSKAEGWYRRLQKARARGASRQIWDAGTAGASPGLGPLSWRGCGDECSGLTLSEQATARGAGADPSDGSGVTGPVGVWGRRTTVRDAWLYVDGRSAAALPWQAFAAITAAGNREASGTAEAQQFRSNGDSLSSCAAADEAEALLGKSAASGGALSQLTVRGKRLLVKLMWLKSAAGVLRGLGGEAGWLEQRLVQLLQQNTQPAGLELLLWSVEDEQQQQQQQQQQRQQAKQADRCAMPLQSSQQHQQQQQQGGATASGAAAAAEHAQSSLLGAGTGTPVWRQQSTPEKVLQPYLRGPLPQVSSSTSGVVARQNAGLGDGGNSSIGWSLGDMGHLHGEHLPLLPAARRAPLTGPRRTTQQQPPVAHQMEWQQALGSQLPLAGQQQQQRRWHISVDDLALRARHEQQQQQRVTTDLDCLQHLPSQQQQQWALQQQQQQQQQYSQAAAAVGPGMLPMSVQRKALMRRTTAEAVAGSFQWPGPAYEGVLGDHIRGQGNALQQQQQQQQQQMSVSSLSGAGAGNWRPQQQQQHGYVRQTNGTLPAVVGGQPGLFLSVSGEGNIALPAYRQSNLQALSQQQQQQQQQLQQQQQQWTSLGSPQWQPLQEDPTSKLWLIPELHKLQPTSNAGGSQALVSFVNTKPQQQRHRTRQQQEAALSGQPALSQQQQQLGPVRVQAAVEQGIPVDRQGSGTLAGHSWGHFTLMGQGQLLPVGAYRQQQHFPGVLLPQLPGSLRSQQQHQQRQLWASYAGPLSSLHEQQQHQHQQQAGSLAADRPVRVSSSDPGSAALRHAVAAVKGRTGYDTGQAGNIDLKAEVVHSQGLTLSSSACGASGGGTLSGSMNGSNSRSDAAGGLRFGTLSGSGHVAVVEQQLPQVAVLRVAGV